MHYDEVERQFGQWYGRYYYDRQEGIIRALADGEECRQQEIAKRLDPPLSRGGYAVAHFQTLIDGGFVGVVFVGGITRGRPKGLCYLTEQGKALARALGFSVQHGYEELLRRLGSPERVLLALSARGMLGSWEEHEYYAGKVHLWPEAVPTSSGQEFVPDLVVELPWVDYEALEYGYKPLYVRLEMDPCPAAGRADPDRAARWHAYYELNKGCLYVVVPGTTEEELVIREVCQWHAVAKVGVTLYTANVTKPGSIWRKTVLPWLG